MSRNNQTRNKTPFYQKIALVIFGVFLTVVILEIGLRLGGFVLLSIQEYRNTVSIRQKGTYRIMCLGESTTQNEYPPFLMVTLNQRNVGIKFSVIDKSKGGINTSIILSELETYISKYKPDMVIVMMGINDWGDHMPYEVISDSKAMNFLRSFRTYKLTRFLWLHILAKAKEKGFFKSKINGQTTKDLFLGQRIKDAKPKQASISEKEASLEESIRVGPNNDAPYIELGRFYLFKEYNFRQAEKLFRRALELNPKNDAAYLGLWEYYMNTGKQERAEKSCRKALELNPANDAAYCACARVYMDIKGFHSIETKVQVEGLCKKALALNPNNYEAYQLLGWLYYEQGDFSQAEELYKRALEIAPYCEETIFKLGWVYFIQKKLPQAAKLFEKALEINPNNDKAYSALAVLYMEMKKYGSSGEYFRKAFDLRKETYIPITVINYRRLKEALDSRNVKFVCVQYPMRSLEPLKRIFQGDAEGIVFVDNEKIFKDAINKSSYREYFRDMFGGDFGHCTNKGNRLLAENIANTILKEVFRK